MSSICCDMEENKKYETKKKKTARCDAFVYLRWGRIKEETGGGWLRKKY